MLSLNTLQIRLVNFENSKNYKIKIFRPKKNIDYKNIQGDNDT
jgi:hypothetical protein